MSIEWRREKSPEEKTAFQKGYDAFKTHGKAVSVWDLNPYRDARALWEQFGYGWWLALGESIYDDKPPKRKGRVKHEKR